MLTEMQPPIYERMAQIERALGLVETVEPLLRKAADHELDTSASLDEGVGKVLEVANEN